MKTPDSREEEIEKAAFEWSNKVVDFTSWHYSEAFEAGAKWADENPMSLNQKAVKVIHKMKEWPQEKFDLKMEIEGLRQQLAIAKEALENVQWNGKESYNRTFAKSCPSCKGIFPEDITVNGWIKEAVGHKQDCKLKIALAQISELEK